ncbi:MAG: hypothetical protein ACI4D8_01215 [Wujia sp.]
MIEEKIINNKKIKIVTMDSYNQVLSSQDLEMDIRAVQAVKAAIEKAEICKKPIAKYDIEKKKAYIQYANGEIEYVN